MNTEMTTEMNRLFINLSNHPTKNWSDQQLMSAEEYGEVIDMRFPEVDPDASEIDLDCLACEVVDRIMLRSRRYEGTADEMTVHVMGEMTLTYRIVELLKDEGVLCLASTTRRNVVEDGNSKTSVFEFRQFRRY